MRSKGMAGERVSGPARLLGSNSAPDAALALGRVSGIDRSLIATGSASA